MSLWDGLPEELRDSRALDSLESLLDSIDTPTSTEETDSDGIWRVYRTTAGGDNPLSLDPATGRFNRGRGNGNTPIEFPDPRVSVELRLHLNAAGGSPDGRVQLITGTPRAIVRLTFLRGAKLDNQGQLREDPAHPDVKFHLPAIRIRVEILESGETAVKILSASTDSTTVDEIYEFVRMEPAHALIGPGDTVGFAFRTAILDLSGTSGPDGVPDGAFALPGDWQGLYLPEARMFVAPQGLDGLAVSGGVRNLWIGLAEHAGVTGLFELEVVQRGSDPNIRLRFQTPSGEWIGVETSASSTIELPEASRLYVDAAGGLAPYTYSVSVGGTLTTTDRADVTISPSGNVPITVTVSDAAGHTSSRSLTVGRRAATAGGSAPGGVASVVLANSSLGFSRIRLLSQNASSVTLTIDPAYAPVDWIWSDGSTAGEDSASGLTATIPVVEGTTVNVSASRSLATEISCYTLFDLPPYRSNLTEVINWANNEDNTRTESAAVRTGWSGGESFTSNESLVRFSQYPAGTTWTVDGFASYENRDDASVVQRNINLSIRRRQAMMHLLSTDATGLSASAVIEGEAQGHRDAKASDDPLSGDSNWWRATARATLPPGIPVLETVTVELTRPPISVPAEDVDPEPETQQKPDCFRKLGFRVELIRDTFVRAEVYGEFDVHTAAEQRLEANSLDQLPPRTNPSDGIVQFLARLRIAENRSNWDVTAEFRAISADTDGLAKLSAPATGDATGINIVGAIATLSPVLAAVTPASPRDGEIVPLVLATAGVVAIGAAGILSTRHLILHGAELVITNALVDPDNDEGPTSSQVSVMIDIESSFSANLGFIHSDPDKPLTTRYKAVGIRSSWRSDPQPDGTIQYVPLPVFDPSRGYTLDVPQGALVGDGLLANLLRVLATRISRDNPSYLEVEVGMGADLGILTIDTARIRVRLDQLELPQLTKLGASLEIPGTLHGRGVVEITEGGFKGSFDLTITPVNIRASASLAIETLDGVTGVLIGIEVEFPVPIILGSSGLGIYGFMGGVGINYARKELPGIPAPALRWLEEQFQRSGVMDSQGWQHQPGAFAFAAGMLVGTVEGGFLLHAKGIVLIELPGPRLLLVMKADVLKLPPVLNNEQSASFLAVLDIDFGRGTITIGIVAEYSIEKLLEVRVPVTAFFDTQSPKAWLIDLGTFNEPVTVKVLEVIEGTGYLMIHGNGISVLPPPLPATTGLTIATGFHISAVLMGSKSVGLYLEVAAGFDAVVSFDPFLIGGKIYARGELRLFIISIGASAELTVIVGRHTNGVGQEVDDTFVKGEVCGKVSFFFFDIEGCVSLEIGEPPPAPPMPPDLVAGVVLVGRSPALVEGSAVYHSVDGKLADALAAESSDTPPSVPLDAIPVILFDAAPDQAEGGIVLGGEARGGTGLPADPWIKRGNFWWRYRVTRVEINGALSAGKTPATWWTEGLSTEEKHGPALALLDWLPTPTPRAITYGERLITQTRERWGTICREVAQPAPVLWSFDGKPFGPSRQGWKLNGIEWPDSNDTYRSSPVDTRLIIEEPWRTGDYRIDQLQGTNPAVVIGDVVHCPTLEDQRPVINLSQFLDDTQNGFSNEGYEFDQSTADDIALLLADGVSLVDAMAVHSDNANLTTNSEEEPRCEGRILRSPLADSDKPAAGRSGERNIVEEAWSRLNHKAPELGNALRIVQSGGMAKLAVLIMAPLRVAFDQLVIQSRNTSGDVVADQRISSASQIDSNNPLPAVLTQANGPWADPVLRALYVAGRIGGGSKTWGLFYVDINFPDSIKSVDIGWDRQKIGTEAPAFYLIGAVGFSKAEFERHDFDESRVKKERELIETTLAQDPDDHALLQPGIPYTVRIGWKATFIESVDRPASNTLVNWDEIGESVQEFRFAGDSFDQAPVDFTPWLLSTTPAPDELNLLCRQPVRIALATQNVARLFEAYGEELRVYVKGSSGKHPSPPDASPGEHVVIPQEADDLLQPIHGSVSVMTPWEVAIRDIVAELPCVPNDINRTHHEVLTITYDFEPVTDYLLDIVAVPIGAPDTETGRRIYRLGFTTGLFDTVEALAMMVVNSPLHHTYVPQPSALTTLSERPSGSEVDQAIQSAGLPVPEVPRFPRVEVLWNGDAEPQPMAVVLESSEVLWRERPMPTKLVDINSTENPKPAWWAAVNTAWMKPEVVSGPPLAGEPQRAIVTRIIRAPGDTRAIVLLAPGSRGRQIQIDLVIPQNPLYDDDEQRERLFSTVFDRAPWEEI